MARLWKFLIDSRVLVVIGITALLGFLLLGAETIELGLIWSLIAALALLALWGMYWGLRRLWRRRVAQRLTASLAAGSEKSGQGDGPKSEVAVLRKNMLEAINTIKTSKLGLTRGAEALYELPWYMILGNPAAG
jgi:type VI secretion system protein ImpL